MIRKPKHAVSHPDRFMDCKLALEDRLLEMWGDAITAGWGEEEALAAIIEIAENTNLAMHESLLLSVETELKRFRKKKDV